MKNFYATVTFIVPVDDYTEDLSTPEARIKLIRAALVGDADLPTIDRVTVTDIQES